MPKPIAKENEQFAFANSQIAATYAAFPEEIRSPLMKLRQMIFEISNRIDQIGGVEESLKWGEPSYATIAGSPIRLGWKKKDPEKYALYFHCQSKLVSVFRSLYPKTLTFEGNRAIAFHKSARIPQTELQHCIELALTYHRWKNKPLQAAESRP